MKKLVILRDNYAVIQETINNLIDRGQEVEIVNIHSFRDAPTRNQEILCTFWVYGKEVTEEQIMPYDITKTYSPGDSFIYYNSKFTLRSKTRNTGQPIPNGNIAPNAINRDQYYKIERL
jgi:hypothetical protein